MVDDPDMHELRRERWALVSPARTPDHLAAVKLFDTKEEAEAFMARPEWRAHRLLPAQDMSALLRVQAKKGGE